MQNEHEVGLKGLGGTVDTRDVGDINRVADLRWACLGLGSLRFLKQRDWRISPQRSSRKNKERGGQQKYQREEALPRGFPGNGGVCPGHNGELAELSLQGLE